MERNPDKRRQDYKKLQDESVNVETHNMFVKHGLKWGDFSVEAFLAQECIVLYLAKCLSRRTYWYYSLFFTVIRSPVFSHLQWMPNIRVTKGG